MNIENTFLYKNSKTVPSSATDKIYVNKETDVKNIVNTIKEFTSVGIMDKNLYEFFLFKFRNEGYFNLLNKSILLDNKIIDKNEAIINMDLFKAYNQALLEKIIAYNTI